MILTFVIISVKYSVIAFPFENGSEVIFSENLRKILVVILTNIGGHEDDILYSCMFWKPDRTTFYT